MASTEAAKVEPNLPELRRPGSGVHRRYGERPLGPAGTSLEAASKMSHLSMCICIYEYMYNVYIYIYKIHTYVYVKVYVYVYAYVYVYVYLL